jgi:hypothetical protein
MALPCVGWRLGDTQQEGQRETFYPAILHCDVESQAKFVMEILNGWADKRMQYLKKKKSHTASY